MSEARPVPGNRSAIGFRWGADRRPRYPGPLKRTLTTLLVVVALGLIGILLWLRRAPAPPLATSAPSAVQAAEADRDETPITPPPVDVADQREERAPGAEDFERLPAPRPEASTSAQPTPAVAPDPDRPGSIQVTVVDGAGAPAPGALVQFSNVDSRHWVGASTTDELGRVGFESLSLGTLELRAKLEGKTLRSVESVRLTASRPHAEARLVLTEGGSVEGILLDVHGEPAAGISLSIHPKSHRNATSPLWSGYLQRTEAGSDGSFRFEHLTPGHYTLHTRAKGEDLLRVPDRSLELEVFEGVVTQAEFEDLRGTFVELSGLVLRNGEAWSEARVSIHHADRSRGYLGRQVRTDAQGRFEVTLDEGGDYRFQVSGAVVRGSLFDEASIPQAPAHELVLAFETGSIAGRVLGPDGEPLAGIEVMAIGSGAAGSGVGSTTTNEAGEYELPHLLAATYDVSAGIRPMPDMGRSMPNMRTKPAVEPSHLGQAQVADVTLSAGEALSGIDLQLPGAAAIDVLVLDQGGEPVAGALVLCALAENRAHIGAFNARTGEAGRCTIDGLEPGDLRVLTRLGKDASAWHAGTGTMGETLHFEIQLEPGATVTVEVVGASDATESCFVTIRDETGFSLLHQFLEGTSATLGPLAPGNYRVNVAQLDRDTETEQQVLVHPGTDASVRVTLP